MGNCVLKYSYTAVGSATFLNWPRVAAWSTKTTRYGIKLDYVELLYDVFTVKFLLGTFHRKIMIPAYLNNTKYVSCIKIAGLPILPPLVTEDRKKILNKDRAKAVEIENKIKRKRSSIDSGVMTGSYIECLKNGEGQDKENLAPNQLLISDLSCNEQSEYDLKYMFPESDKVTNDRFLQLALEDKEFREFFYITAERIFNDNNLDNTNYSITQNSSLPLQNCCNDIHSTLKDSDCTSHTEHFPNILDSRKVLEPSSELNIVSSMAGGDKENGTCENLHSVCIKTTLSPSQRPVRRNSYTLESPSPVLIEHMAKEIVKHKDESNKWKSLSEKKDLNKNVGFKTFLTATKPRKTWNKRAFNNGSFSKVSTSVSNQPPKTSRVLLKKTKTSTKLKPSFESEDTNYSLPCSSHTSPTLLSNFAMSVDCIKTMVEKSPKKSEHGCDLNSKFLPKAMNEVNSPQHPNSRSSIMSESKVNSLCKIPNVGSVRKENSNPSVLNTTFFSEDFNNQHKTDILSLAQSEMYENLNQISNVTHRILPNDGFTCAQTNDFKGDKFKTDQSVETDEIVSVCSSLSLSKFMRIDETVSRPSTAEEMSTLFSQLQVQHECQIAELLEKQHKEKVMLTMLHSNNGSLSSRSTTNLSFFEENSIVDNVISEDKKTPCSRELFPRQTKEFSKIPKNYRVGEYSSAKDQEAALKLTAYVRGYLARRLLKTEKIQQLKNVMKESLNCALSLQSESKLKRNELELHERLANQVTAAFDELQNIFSAPVSQRMAIIAADREKLRRPPSRPSSAISYATQKSLLRRQQSMSVGEKKPKESRSRAKSFCSSGTHGLDRSGALVKSDSPVVMSSKNTARKSWR